MFDVSPIYPLPDQWHSHSGRVVNDGLHARTFLANMRTAWQSKYAHGGNTRWLDVFAQIKAFSHDSFEGRIPTTPGALEHCERDTGAWTLPIIHGLLMSRPDPDVLLPKHFRIQEACRLGSLLYMVRVWRFCGVAPVASETLLAKFQNVINNHDDNWGQLWTFLLWLLYVGAIEAQDGPLETWFLERIVSVSVFNGVKTCEESIAIVQRVLWFTCIFGARHAALQERIQLCFDR